MATAEWEIPFQIETPYSDVAGADLLFNTDLGSSMGSDWAGRQFALNGPSCFSRRSVRAETDPVPQGDGDIFHERYATGYEMVFAIQLWSRFPSDGDEGQAACDVALCEMRDLLFGHLWSLLRPPNADGGRVIWNPSCGDNRMMDAVLLLALQDPEITDRGATEYTCTLDSPFPYAMTHAQDTTSFTGTQTVPNDGNVDFWPVIKVNGSGLTSFTLESDIPDQFGNNLKLEWDSQYGGQSITGYAEIDTFRGTIFLNGDGADLSGSWIPTESDFFPIQPGGTAVTSSASVDFLTNDAWA